MILFCIIQKGDCDSLICTRITVLQLHWFPFTEHFWKLRNIPLTRSIRDDGQTDPWRAVLPNLKIKEWAEEKIQKWKKKWVKERKIKGKKEKNNTKKKWKKKSSFLYNTEQNHTCVYVNVISANPSVAPKCIRTFQKCSVKGNQCSCKTVNRVQIKLSQSGYFLIHDLSQGWYKELTRRVPLVVE
jgi:hypothetical protein